MSWENPQAENSRTATDVKGTGGKKGHSGGFTPGLRWGQRTFVCYISGKELVDHRTRVQTMHAPAGDVQAAALGNAVGSCEDELARGQQSESLK